MRVDIEFLGCGGTILRGWLYLPGIDDGMRRPLVIMTHGFSAIKEMVLDQFAEVFCRAQSRCPRSNDRHAFGHLWNGVDVLGRSSDARLTH